MASLYISILSLLISIATFWITKIKRGIIKMTRPTLICFVPELERDEAKIFLRMLLYSTSEQGQYIQNMFIRVERQNSTYDFNIWAYDDNGIKRGSGLYVSKAGIAFNHHFLLPHNEVGFNFLAEEYNLEVFVETVDKKLTKIYRSKFIVTEQQQRASQSGKVIFYNWAPNTGKYISHVDSNKIKDLPNLF